MQYLYIIDKEKETVLMLISHTGSVISGNCPLLVSMVVTLDVLHWNISVSICLVYFWWPLILQLYLQCNWIYIIIVMVIVIVHVHGQIMFAVRNHFISSECNILHQKSSFVVHTSNVTGWQKKKS